LRSYTDNVKCYECIQMEYAGRDPRQAWPDYDAHVRDVHQRHYDGQIGSEATPAEWVAALVGCTAEWVRVLKPSGSIFVNLGDKYAGGGGFAPDAPSNVRRRSDSAHQEGAFTVSPSLKRRLKGGGVSARDAGVPAKSLLGLPWRYALACMDQLGLILRRDIIWSKPNGLPESVVDRCRSSHEYLFHFTVQPRYYAAVDEIREPHAPAPKGKHDPGSVNGLKVSHVGNGHAGVAGIRPDPNPLGKLPGSVWSIPSQPLTVPAALGVDHFAAFPMELPRRCVLGWSPPGVCTACGEGRRPVTDVQRISSDALRPPVDLDRRKGGHHGMGSSTLGPRGVAATITGYACACTPYTDRPGTGEATQRRGYSPGLRDNNAQGTYGRHQAGEYDRTGPWREYHFGGWTPPPTRPSLVVDPFGGTGTTALVAAAYGRTGVSVDLSGDYCRLARWRTRDPAERARALEVPKPPPVPDGQGSLFDDWEAS
jgi:DNA modification methylase